MPTTHVMHYENGDESNVYWRCGVCRRSVGFNREGIGNPWASETFLPVDDVDPAIGVCPNEYIPDPDAPSNVVSKDEFIARFASVELGQMHNSTDDMIQGFMQKLVYQTTVDLADPDVMSVLLHANALGILADHRPAIIIA